MIDFSLAPRKAEMLEALTKILKVKSVKSDAQGNMPYGKGVFEALIKMLNIAETLDFDSVNYYSHLGYVEYGDGDEMLAIVTHLDVVPAGEGWTVPAFDGTVKDGKIYGRGAIDDKGPAVAALFALSGIKENCVTLNKRVRIIFGCDEESGWGDIDFYKQSGGEIPMMAISPDAEFPIVNAEKGLLHLEVEAAAYPVEEGGNIPEILFLKAGERVNVVPALCECVVRGGERAIRQMAEIFNEDSPVKVALQEKDGKTFLHTHGVSAHGSKPEDGKNALTYMMLFLNLLPLKKNALSDMVYLLSAAIGDQTDGRSLGIACEDFSGALSLNIGYMKTTEAGAQVGIDIRYPVGADKNDILKKIKAKLPGLSVTEVFSRPSHYVPEDSPLVQGLKQAYEEVTGDPAYCITMGGATYARAFPNSVAFGALFPGQTGTEHQPDEYIEIDSLVRVADIIANAIVTLCK
ncbi:MAG: dipeptidase PepV [Christensenella sp.]|nr:dipeptidase PepV [Christensenella sp.]